MSTCPVCDATIELDQSTVQGELIECKECAVELEVTNLSPLSFEEAPQEEEDWGE